MSRNTLIYTVQMQGRDFGKTFVLTEMAAKPAFNFAVRVAAAMINGGAPLPDDLKRSGWPALAVAAITGMRYMRADDVIEFGDELMSCVQKKEEKGVRPLFEGDIEEFSTYGLLQKAVFELHRDPFIIGVKSILGLTPEPAVAPV